MATRYELPKAELVEVCVQFAAAMGWIRSPGGSEWAHRILSRGGAEGFVDAANAALALAMDLAKEGQHITVEAARKTLAEWEQIEGPDQ